MDDPGAELAELFASLDPEAWLKALCLGYAENRCGRDKDHNQVMAVAAAYFEFVDPLAERPTFTLKLEGKP